MSREATPLPEFQVEFEGKQYSAELAKVDSYSIGREDHGIFTAQIGFVGFAWGQGISPMGLGGYHEKEPDAANKSMDYLMRLTDTLGSPEDGKGKRVVVFREGKSRFGMIVGFATLNDDGSYNKPFWNRMEV